MPVVYTRQTAEAEKYQRECWLRLRVVTSDSGFLTKWSNYVLTQSNSVALTALPFALRLPFFDFVIFPSQMRREQSMRVEASPSITTVDGNPFGIVDVWGAGLPTWTFSGTTGYGMRLANYGGMPVYVDGWNLYMAMTTFFDMYQKEKLYRLTQGFSGITLLLYNSAESFEDAWLVEPTQYPTKTRSADRPKMFQYEVRFVGITPYTAVKPIPDTVLDMLSKVLERIRLIKDMLVEQLNTLLDYANSITRLGNDITNTIKNLTSSVSTVVDGLNETLDNFKNMTSNFAHIRDTAEQAITSINNACANQPLSEFFNVAHACRQIACGARTALSIPTGVWGTLNIDMTNIESSKTQSGCGTTIQGTIL